MLSDDYELLMKNKKDRRCKQMRIGHPVFVRKHKGNIVFHSHKMIVDYYPTPDNQPFYVVDVNPSKNQCIIHDTGKANSYYAMNSDNLMIVPEWLLW